MPSTRHSPYHGRYYRPYANEQLPAHSSMDETVNPAFLDLSQSLPPQCQFQESQHLHADPFMGGTTSSADLELSPISSADLELLPSYAPRLQQQNREQLPVHSTMARTDVQSFESFQTADDFLGQADALIDRAYALLGGAGGTAFNGIASAPSNPSPYQKLKVISSRPAQNPKYFSQSFYNRLLDFCVLARKQVTRVETALAIRLQLKHPPPGIKRLRIHINHLRKLATQADWRNKPFENDAVEIRGVVFLGQAMDSDEKRFKAISKARAKVMLEIKEEARGDIFGGEPPVPGDVAYTAHIEPLATPCDHCIAREKRRLLRGTRDKKKSAVTPEWAAETARSILSLSSKAKTLDWQPRSSKSTKPAIQPRKGKRKSRPQTEDDLEDEKPLPPVEEGAVAVDLDLRICCYNRHHHEKGGFRIIFFLCNNKGEIVGETITEPILIADQHKVKIPPATTPPSEPQPAVQQQPLPQPAVQQQALPQPAVQQQPLPQSAVQQRALHQPALQQQPQVYDRLYSPYPAQPCSNDRFPDNGHGYNSNDRFPDNGQGYSLPPVNDRYPDNRQGYSPPHVNYMFPDNGQGYSLPNVNDGFPDNGQDYSLTQTFDQPQQYQSYQHQYYEHQAMPQYYAPP